MRFGLAVAIGMGHQFRPLEIGPQLRQIHEAVVVGIHFVEMISKRRKAFGQFLAAELFVAILVRHLELLAGAYVQRARLVFTATAAGAQQGRKQQAA